MLVIAGLLFKFTIVKMRGPNKSLKLKKKLKLKEELKILLKNSFGKINRQQSYHVLLTKRVLDPKARPVRLWELSSQGTESSPKTARLKYYVSTMTAFATNCRIKPNSIEQLLQCKVAKSEYIIFVETSSFFVLLIL